MRVDLQFLADVYLVCEVCRGRRYSPPLLEVRYHGKTIDEVLNLTVHEALHFFAGQTRVHPAAQGLRADRPRLPAPGPVRGHPLGGRGPAGEAGRPPAPKPGPRVLYILDEPTTGLHLGDVSELMDCFDRLLEGGATLLVIEHHLDVIKRADWVIDLGPEGGEEGGAVVFEGHPRGPGRVGPRRDRSLPARGPSRVPAGPEAAGVAHGNFLLSSAASRACRTRDARIIERCA